MTELLHERLRHANIALATHEVGTVPVHVLRDYLRPLAKGVLFIHHPLLYQGLGRGRRSMAKTYGDLASRSLGASPGPIAVEPVAYLKDALLTLRWVLQCRVRFDIFVGAGNLNAFSGLLLRHVGVVRRVAYYAIDYMPRRFANPVMNAIYRRVEATCVKYCDATWNLAPAMIDARAASGIRTSRRQLITPIGTHVARVPKLAAHEIVRKRIVFVGNLMESHGLQLVLSALPALRASIPDVCLVVYGTGPYRRPLEELASALGVDDCVEFRGYLDDHAALERELARGGVAVATYDPKTAVFTPYTDPGKVKDYLVAGLPIVMTGVPSIASQLDSLCARVIPYDHDACVTALEELLRNDHIYFAMRKNAWEIAEQYDWSHIFDRAIAATWL